MTLQADPSERSTPPRPKNARRPRQGLINLLTVLACVLGLFLSTFYLFKWVFTPTPLTVAQKEAALTADTNRYFMNLMVQMCQAKITGSAAIPASVKYVGRPNVGLYSHVTGEISLENRLGLRVSRTYGCWWSDKSMDVFGIFEGAPRRPFNK